MIALGEDILLSHCNVDSLQNITVNKIVHVGLDGWLIG